LKNLMKYGDYCAKIEYSPEDHCFFGWLMGINDSISFEGQSITELESSFKEAVDDYIDLCERMGKEPEKTYKGSFNVRIKPELHKKLDLMAASKGTSINKMIELAVENMPMKIDQD